MQFLRGAERLQDCRRRDQPVGILQSLEQEGRDLSGANTFLKRLRDLVRQSAETWNPLNHRRVYARGREEE
jgi:hypothetical protein